MLITEIIGNASHIPLGNRTIDRLPLEWYECTKKVQRKKSGSGVEISIRMLKEGQRLKQDDILFINDDRALVVEILPTDAIVITPVDILEMGRVCYEIGNKHLPLFIQDNKVMIPYEEPIFNWLKAGNYDVRIKNVRLLNMLNANVQPHSHGSTSLFSKILNLASKQDNT
ncbi:MAG TPA: urease accessory protein UreE [Flavitalea sp.]|nr:urease accessory protein UreE [Flavitalea sp.]